MGERYDVTLGTNGYLVAPKSYRRGLDRVTTLGGPPVRIVQREWRGALRATQRERDRYWTSVGLRPRLDGAGLGPGPLQRAPVTIAGLTPLVERYWVLAGGRPYLAAGDKLWQLDRAGAGPYLLGGATQLGGVLGATASGLAQWRDASLFVARSGSDLWRWDIGGVSFTTYASLTFKGVAVYVGSVWGLGSAAEPARLLRVADLAAGTVDAAGWTLDGALRSTAVVVRDALYVATARSLWRCRMGGPASAPSYDVQPLFSGDSFGDAFVYLADYQGELYTWYAGEVRRLAPGGRLESTGLRADSCVGLTVAGNVLVAGVIGTAQYSGNQLWAYDGAGWWCLGVVTDVRHPFGSGGYFDDASVLAGIWGQSQLTGWQLRELAVQPGLAPTGEVVSSWWTGPQPDEDKRWVRVGCEMVAPGQASSPGLPDYGAITVTLSYSLDGTNFTVAGSQALDTSRATTLAYTLPAGTSAKGIALKWALSGVSDGGPTLTALWAEYRTQEAPVRRRHWEFDILAGDEQVDRLGSAVPRSGRQIAAELWAAWESGAPLAYRDLDYDLAPTVRTVRIVDLTEGVKVPGDAGRWGESVVSVKLVEV